MKLNLTDGNSGVTVNFCEVVDMRQCNSIRNSSRPVTTAFRIARERLASQMGEDVAPSEVKLWPIEGVALEGLEVKEGVH